MYDTFLSIIPVEFKPMSIITLLLLVAITYMLTQNQKTITKEIKNIKQEHQELENDLSITKKKINDEFTQFVKNTTEIKQSNKYILVSINEIKQDLRDLRNKK